MPTRSLVRAFITLYVTVGAVVLIQSLHTVLDAWRGEAFTGGRRHALVVGGFEIAAALLFLVPRTMRIGALGFWSCFSGVLHSMPCMGISSGRCWSTPRRSGSFERMA